MLTTVKSLITEVHSEALAESFCDWQVLESNRHLKDYAAREHRDGKSKLSVTVIVIKHEFF